MSFQKPFSSDIPFHMDTVRWAATDPVAAKSNVKHLRSSLNIQRLFDSWAPGSPGTAETVLVPQNYGRPDLIASKISEPENGFSAFFANVVFNDAVVSNAQ